MTKVHPRWYSHHLIHLNLQVVGYAMMHGLRKRGGLQTGILLAMEQKLR